VCGRGTIGQVMTTKSSRPNVMPRTPLPVPPPQGRAIAYASPLGGQRARRLLHLPLKRGGRRRRRRVGITSRTVQLTPTRLATLGDLPLSGGGGASGFASHPRYRLTCDSRAPPGRGSRLATPLPCAQGTRIDSPPGGSTLRPFLGGSRKGLRFRSAGATNRHRGDPLNLIRVMPAKGQDLSRPARISRLALTHDLVRKPVPTFRDHAAGEIR